MLRYVLGVEILLKVIDLLGFFLSNFFKIWREFIEITNLIYIIAQFNYPNILKGGNPGFFLQTECRRFKAVYQGRQDGTAVFRAGEGMGSYAAGNYTSQEQS